MIRFALIVASTLGFVLTAALGNLMTPLLRAFRVQQEENEPPTMGGLCLMVGTLAAVGVGWTAACVAQPELLGTESLLTTRLLIALFGALLFGGVGLADDIARIRRRSPLGLRRGTRLLLEAGAGTVVLVLLGANGCLAGGMALPGAGYVGLGVLAPLLCPDAPPYKGLDEWLGHFRLQASERHHASADALATAELALILFSKARRQGLDSLAELQRRAQSWRRRQLAPSL